MQRKKNLIAILDYEAGNLTSVELAVRHVGGVCRVTQDPHEVAEAERILFPGVGSARSCMNNLRRLGLDQALREALEKEKPILAICIGLQLLFEFSEEDGGVPCLGLLPGKVIRFAFPPGKKVKIPHMGWNEIEVVRPHPLLADFAPGDECYFVHSYYPIPSRESDVYATTEYEGIRFCSAAGRGSIFATQFHPEKSGAIGLTILRRFLTWRGSGEGFA